MPSISQMAALARKLALGLMLWCGVQAQPAQAQLMKPGQDIVRACGSIAVALPLSEVVPVFRSERNIELVLRSAGGTSNGLEALSERSVNMALSSREVTPVDRANNPEMQLVETPLGLQVLLLTVSQDVWNAGVHSLSSEQMRGIYEGDITSWKQLGGPDTKIRLFVQEEGRGNWEMLVQWLYGEIRKAPVWKGSRVKSMQETRNMLEFTPGAVSLLPPAFVDNQSVYAVSLKNDANKVIDPTYENIFNKTYPLFRPLGFVTNDRPTGAVKVIIDFMTGERGQAILKQYGYLTVPEIEAARKKTSGGGH
ncbi:MAG: substrate-binding domain-containing protein [Chthoniobacteraceae bacterium]